MKKYLIMLVILTILLEVSEFFMPDTVPLHYNISGAPDRMGSKYWMYLFDLLPLAVYGLMSITKKIDPRKENLEKSDNYELMKYLVTGLILGITIIMTASIFFKELSIQMGLLIILGVFFVMIGNYMPRIKHNYFLGIKTPWAIHDENNWKATHRIGGIKYVVLGLLFIVSAFLPGNIAFTITMVSVLVSTVFLYAYSYWYFKKHQ